jgi:hypothetical protein
MTTISGSRIQNTSRVCPCGDAVGAVAANSSPLAPAVAAVTATAAATWVTRPPSSTRVASTTAWAMLGGSEGVLRILAEAD